MALTREFRHTVARRMEREPAFRRGVLEDSINEMLLGELDAGKAMLRDYINSTLGFAKLAERTGIPDKSLQRMLGPRGNPTATNLFKLIGVLQRNERVVLEVRTRNSAA